MSPAVDEERMRPGHWLGSVPCNFLKCLDTVGRMSGKTSKDSLLERAEEEN